MEAKEAQEIGLANRVVSTGTGEIGLVFGLT